MRSALLLLACTAATKTYAQDTEKEKVVKAYYAGFVNKDWGVTSNQMADDFTFTSPVGDNHISMAAYKEKCFPTSKFFKTVNFLQMVESGNQVFLLVQINTTDNKIVRNVDIFTFNDAGKIQAHECFFGAGEGYPGHHSN